VGIGVGVGTAALLFAGVFIWVCLRRRRDRARRPRDNGAGELVPYGTPELEANAAKIRLELAGEKCDVTPELPGEALGGSDGAGGLLAARGGRFGGVASTGYGEPSWPAELDAAPHRGMATVVAPVVNMAVMEAGAEVPQGAKRLSPSSGSGETRLGGHPAAEPAIAPVKSSTDVASATLAVSASDRTEEKEFLEHEESRLAARRATLQETIRLLEEDERLQKEQEAVRRRLEELQRAP
jgi:hypothetical protein